LFQLDQARLAEPGWLPGGARPPQNREAIAKPNGQRRQNATHSRSTAIDSIDVFYRESDPADAPVLRLRHGFPTSSRMFRDLFFSGPDHQAAQGKAIRDSHEECFTAGLTRKRSVRNQRRDFGDLALLRRRRATTVRPAAIRSTYIPHACTP